MAQALADAAILAPPLERRLEARRARAVVPTRAAFWLLAPSLFLLFLFTYVPILEA